MEIKLSDLWSIFKKFLLLILLVAVLCAALAAVGTKYLMQEKYTTEGIYLLEPKKPSSGNVENINQDTIVASRVMANLGVILQTDIVMKNLLDYIAEMHEQDPTNEDYMLDYTYTAKQLLSLIDFELPMDEGGYLISATVVVTAYSAHDAKVLSIAFRDICNEHMPHYYSAAYSLNPLFDVPREGVKTAPNVKQNTVIGFALGALLAYGTVLLLRLFKQRVYSAEDLSASFGDIPVLGNIPEIRVNRRRTEKKPTNTEK